MSGAISRSCTFFGRPHVAYADAGFGQRRQHPRFCWSFRRRGVSDERIYEMYSEAELAIVPSLYEGFSLPAIEAMSCGIPVVSTTGGALPEVVGADGDTALLVPPGDSEALAAKIRMALDDPSLRSAIGARGRQRVIDNWSWRHTAERTLEQYRALLAETHDRTARR